jgi:hypothetical protein
MRPGPADRRDLVRPAAAAGALPRTSVRPRTPNTTDRNTTDTNEPMALTDLAHPYDPEVPTPEHSRTEDGGEAG